MTKRKRLMSLALCCVSWLSAVRPLAQGTAEVSVTVRADQPGPVINPNVYGQFAEHLGAGIYEGIWVGEKSTHPQHQRLSQRRGRGAQGTQGAGGALARRLLRGRIPLARRHRRRVKNAR